MTTVNVRYMVRDTKEAIAFSGINNTNQLGIFGRIYPSKLAHGEKGYRIGRLTVLLAVDPHPRTGRLAHADRQLIGHDT